MSEYEPRKYWEDRLSKDFSLGGVGFLGLGLNYNRWLYRVRRHVLLRAIKRHNINPVNCSVLEVGVGTGFYVTLWQKLGVKNIVGLDITETAVRNLERKYPEYEFVQGDISQSLPPMLGKFDIVTALDVLFHITEDYAFNQAIKNLRMVSHTGSYILISDLFLRYEVFSSFHQKSRLLQDYVSKLSQQGISVIDRLPIFCLMTTPLDCPSSPLMHWWNALLRFLFVTKRAGMQRIMGEVTGAVLFPIEISLSRFLREGPSTELMICRVTE